MSTRFGSSPKRSKATARSTSLVRSGHQQARRNISTRSRPVLLHKKQQNSTHSIQRRDFRPPNGAPPPPPPFPLGGVKPPSGSPPPPPFSRPPPIPPPVPFGRPPVPPPPNGAMPLPPSPFGKPPPFPRPPGFSAPPNPPSPFPRPPGSIPPPPAPPSGFPRSPFQPPVGGSLPVPPPPPGLGFRPPIPPPGIRPPGIPPPPGLRPPIGITPPPAFQAGRIPVPPPLPPVPPVVAPPRPAPAPTPPPPASPGVAETSPAASPTQVQSVFVESGSTDENSQTERYAEQQRKMMDFDDMIGAGGKKKKNKKNKTQSAVAQPATPLSSSDITAEATLAPPPIPPSADPSVAPPSSPNTTSPPHPAHPFGSSPLYGGANPGLFGHQAGSIPGTGQTSFSRILSALAAQNHHNTTQHVSVDRNSQLQAQQKEEAQKQVDLLNQAMAQPTSESQIKRETELLSEFNKQREMYQIMGNDVYNSYLKLHDSLQKRKEELRDQRLENRLAEEEELRKQLENKDIVIIKPMQSIAALSRAARVSNKKVLELLAEIEDIPRNALSLINAEQAELVMATLGKKVHLATFESSSSPRNMMRHDGTISRAPVVTIVGHVDHGKTTLLDALRKTNVAKHEAGRITQSIGGFNVHVPEELQEFIPSITFLDTPGHAIFKNMRERGTTSGLTDIAILILAATDGVQPMTRESAALIKKNNIPCLVAVTKVDIQGSNTQKVLRQLAAECDLITEAVGGDIPFVEVSAPTGQGLDQIIEQIATISTDHEIVYKPRPVFNKKTIESWNENCRNIAKGQPFELKQFNDQGEVIRDDITDIKEIAEAYAFVVESKQQPGGAHVDVVVRQGSIRVGDFLVCGLESGTVRGIINHDDEHIEEATGQDSTPVRILGLTPKDITSLGNDLVVLPSRELATAVAERRQYEIVARDMLQQIDAERLNPTQKTAPERVQQGHRSRALQIRGSSAQDADLQAEEDRTVYVSLKADVKGSLDALLNYVSDLGKSPNADAVIVKVIKSGIGTDICKEDIDFAETRGGNVRIFGFNTKITNKVSSYAGEKNIDIFSSEVIFDVFDQFQEMLSQKLPTIPQDVVLGTAVVQQIFPINYSRLQWKKLAVEASSNINGDPVPIHGTPSVLGSRVVSGELQRAGAPHNDLSEIFWRVRRAEGGGKDQMVNEDMQCLSIRHFKDVVPKLAKGNECGILLNNSDGVQAGDYIDCYRTKFVHEKFDDSIARGFRTEEPEWKKYQKM